MKELEKLKKLAGGLPQRSGVYLFLGQKSQVLYVGKAKNLHKRIMAYFSPGTDGRPQIPKMLEWSRDLQFVVTPNEKEALLLENSLIKQNRPPYNICLKDDKTYQSLRIHLSHPYPRLSVVRKTAALPRDEVFGPYTEAGDLRKAVQYLTKIFQIRDCTDAEFKRRKRPCLKYDIHLCSAPCVGKIELEDYKNAISQAVSFLRGRNKSILKSLRMQIDKWSKELRFEEARATLDKLTALEEIHNRRSLVTGIRSDCDAIGFAREGKLLLFQVLQFREGLLLRTETRVFENAFGSLPEILRVFIEQYYFRKDKIPPTVLLETLPEDNTLLEKILSDRSTKAFHLTVPQKGVKKQILDLAQTNARVKVMEIVQRTSGAQKSLEEMKRLFHLEKTPLVIEGYDISHHGGLDTVGVKVSFKNGLVDKSAYRKYLVKNSRASDDYQSLSEVLRRRILRGIKEKNLPDLFLLDGGLGQLNVFKKVVQALGLNLNGVAIAKETHSKSSQDKLFLMERKNPLKLPAHHPAMRKLMEIRDEAHRFALTFHQNKRTKRIFLPK